MKTRIINIGDELLIGQVVNSNAAVMSQLLLENGYTVDRCVVVGDEGKAISKEIDEAFQAVDIVLLTGGLGPTKDDVTKQVLCQGFQRSLVFHEESLRFIEGYLKLRGVPMSETNRQQALIPEGATVMPNRWGTAPGICLEENGKVLISLPGVPLEMTQLMKQEVIPFLCRRFRSEEQTAYKVVQLMGIGESTLSDRLEAWETALPPHLTLAYLPDSGIIRLRLTGHSHDASALEQELDEKLAELCALVPDYVVSREDKTMAELVSDLLRKKQLTLSMAESCTGGSLAQQITSLAGCSEFFKGSVVSYANQAKSRLLNISSETLQREGAVSQVVVEQMAVAARQLFQTDFALATSGIAGPGGGSDEKPVGTVWIAVASEQGIRSKKFQFGKASGRLGVVKRTCLQAFNMLREELT